MGASLSSDLARRTGAPSGGDGVPTQTDFVYDLGMARATVAFGAIVTIITTGSIVARLYSRYFVTKHVRVDDAWAVGALLSTICVFIMQAIFAMVYLPHATSLTIAANKGSRIPYATNVTYNIAMALLKLTFLFQFYHIFRQVRVMRMVYVVAIGVVSAWSLAQILLTIFVCIPVEANWNPNIQGKCLPSVVATYVNATGTILTDIIVLFLPLPTLLSLKLRGRQIWAVLGVFGVGAIVPVISVGRIQSLSRPPPEGYLSTACWTIAELGVGITAASLATIRHLMDRKVSTLIQESQGMSRIDSSPGAAPHDGTRQFTHRTSGSEVDLIGGAESRKPGWLAFLSKKKGGSTVTWVTLTPNNGATRTNITSFRDKDMPISQGAANFLGEFGILVEKTWEVEEIRMK